MYDDDDDVTMLLMVLIILIIIVFNLRTGEKEISKRNFGPEKKKRLYV